jgi:CrcB protein
VILAVVVAAAGATGAITRFVVDGAVQDRASGVLPLGTLTVNLSGSFVLGLLTGLLLFHGLAHDGVAVLGTGFCGGFSTWSAASWETVRLVEEGEGGAALLNVVGGIAASLAAAGLGLLVAAL